MGSTRSANPTRDDELVDLDFLIVGGGIQGVTLLHELVEAGARRILLATRDDLGVGETLHSHGYLHHGYMMPASSRAVVRELSECGAWWWQRVETSGSSYSAQPPVYYGVSAAGMAERVRIWDELALAHQPATGPAEALHGGSAADGSTRLFTTADRTVSMREILADLAAPLQNRIVRAGLTRLTLDDAGTRIVECHLSHGSVDLIVRPRVLLLATGRFTQPLLRAARTPAGDRPLFERCRALNNIRFVPMLLVRGRNLPAVTGFFEGHATSVYTHPMVGGLGDESMWIVTYHANHETDRGDFDESRETVSHLALREALERLSALVPVARQRLRTDLRFSSYMGGKIDHPEGGNARYIDDCGISNLRVAWPGLWSLALANARDIAREFRSTPSGVRALDPRDLGLRPGVPVGEERRLTGAQSWQPYPEFERGLPPRR